MNPNTPAAEEVAERLRHHPVEGRLVGSSHPVRAGVVHGVHDHAQQRQRLERGEEAADREPVRRRADPEVVMAQAEDAGAQHQRDLDIEPGLDDAPRGSEQLHQRQRHDAADQDLPGRLHPQVHQPPPPVEILGHVGDRREGDQVQGEERHQVHHQAPP